MKKNFTFYKLSARVRNGHKGCWICSKHSITLSQPKNSIFLLKKPIKKMRNVVFDTSNMTLKSSKGVFKIVWQLVEKKKKNVSLVLLILIGCTYTHKVHKIKHFTDLCDSRGTFSEQESFLQFWHFNLSEAVFIYWFRYGIIVQSIKSFILLWLILVYRLIKKTMFSVLKGYPAKISKKVWLFLCMNTHYLDFMNLTLSLGPFSK